MNSEHKNDITYKTYIEDRDLEQLSILEKHLWSISDNDIKRVFQWKYPAVASIRNGFVAYDGNRLVGFRGFFINNYTDGKNTFPVAVLGDAVVHPEYQRRGIFSKLTSSAIEYFKTTDLKYILALSSNEKSSAGYIKLGWSPFAHKARGLRPVFCNILPIKTLFNYYIGKTLSRNNYTVECHSIIDTYTACQLAEYCKSNEIENKIQLSKDRSFWEYRYACPIYNYKTLILRKENNICGYVTISEAKGASNGIAHTKILDFAANDSAELKLLINKVELSTNNKIILISLAAINPYLAKTINRLFFFKRQSRNGNISDYYLVKSIHEAGDNLPEFILNYIDIDSM